MSIAEQLGIHINSLNSRLNGNPTIESIIEIADILDVDVRDLILPTINLPPAEKLQKAEKLIQEAREELGLPIKEMS